MSTWVNFTAKEVLDTLGGQLLVYINEHGPVWIPTVEIYGGGEYKKGDKDVVLSITEWYADNANISGSCK